MVAMIRRAVTHTPMNIRPLLALLSLLGLTACARVVRSGDDGGSPANDGVRVYAHTSLALFTIDPRTLGYTQVGAFRWPTRVPDEMTDLAINAAGEAWGVTFTGLYRVDLATAECTYVAPLGGSYNGLAFVPAGESGAEEVLVATDRGGGMYRVDTTTGATQLIGSFGYAIGSSGDIVAGGDGETFATVIDLETGDAEVEYLARIDPVTGRATRIGPTGVRRTWGIGHWRSSVYGFTADGALVSFDVTTGRATELDRSLLSWTGVAVTYAAP